MKIEQKREIKFEPITLTIETKQELLLMLHLLGSISDTTICELTDESVKDNFMYKAYSLLLDIASTYGLSDKAKGCSIKCLKN